MQHFDIFFYVVVTNLLCTTIVFLIVATSRISLRVICFCQEGLNQRRCNKIYLAFSRFARRNLPIPLRRVPFWSLFGS